MPGTKGKDGFMREALSAVDEESAGFFMHVAQILKGYHAKVAPIQDITARGPLVFGKASNGTCIIPLPIDRALWTEHAAHFVPGAVQSHKAANPDVKHYELWVTGTASKTAQERAAKNGAKTLEGVGSKVELTY